MSLSDIILHNTSNVSLVTQLMHFIPRKHGAIELSSLHLPSLDELDRLSTTMASSSCAVVGPGKSLLNCTDSADICKHDVIIHINDHPKLLTICPRVDIQVVNAFACVGNQAAHCNIKPRLFRLRHEWNPRMAKRFSNGAWLSTGLMTDYVNSVLIDRIPHGRCCNSAGGAAVALSLKTCKHTTLYGIGSRTQQGYIDDSKKDTRNSVHDFESESQWFRFLNRHRHVQMRCT